MFLHTRSYLILSFLLLATPSLSTNSYTAHLTLTHYDYRGFIDVRQQCIHIARGICCRRLNLPGALTRFQTFHSVSFQSMEPRDIALIWTPDPPAPAHAGPAAGDPLPSAAGCHGRVLASKMMERVDSIWSYRTDERDPITNERVSSITGSSYVSMPPKQSITGYDGITGIRALLGGGGKMFGAKNRTDLAVYPYRVVSRRDAVKEDAGGRREWVWPNRITLNGTEYAQVGGWESLVYRSGLGEALDLGPYNLHD